MKAHEAHRLVLETEPERVALALKSAAENVRLAKERAAAHQAIIIKTTALCVNSVQHAIHYAASDGKFSVSVDITHWNNDVATSVQDIIRADGYITMIDHVIHSWETADPPDEIVLKVSWERP